MKITEIEANVTQRRAGRPRAIGDELGLLVMSLYRSGLGYRSITHELVRHGVFVDWSTVRRVIKRWLSEKDHHNAEYSNSDTILQRGALGGLSDSSQTIGPHS
jgi:hypothetical protein